MILIKEKLCVSVQKSTDFTDLVCLLLSLKKRKKNIATSANSNREDSNGIPWISFVSKSEVFQSNTKQHFYYRMKNPTFTIEYKTTLLLSNTKQHFYYRIKNNTFTIEYVVFENIIWKLSKIKPYFYYRIQNLTFFMT